ncbi:MAG: hypothetical protein ACWA5K_09790, partial [bacterium]
SIILPNARRSGSRVCFVAALLVPVKLDRDRPAVAQIDYAICQPLGYITMELSRQLFWCFSQQNKPRYRPKKEAA